MYPSESDSSFPVSRRSGSRWTGSFAAAVASVPRSATRSQGAFFVNDSSSAASAGDGSQPVGGATTREREDALGPSATIIAVCARKSWAAANWAPADEPAEAEPRMALIPESASSAGMLAPADVFVRASALSYGGVDVASSPLLSTTVLMPPARARLDRVSASAGPPAGQATARAVPVPVPSAFDPNVLGRILLASASPSW